MLAALTVTAKLMWVISFKNLNLNLNFNCKLINVFKLSETDNKWQPQEDGNLTKLSKMPDSTALTRVFQVSFISANLVYQLYLPEAVYKYTLS